MDILIRCPHRRSVLTFVPRAQQSASPVTPQKGATLAGAGADCAGELETMGMLAAADRSRDRRCHVRLLLQALGWTQSLHGMPC